MISQIRSQRDEILEAKDEVDDRRRFIEAVLSGVTAAVIGVEDDHRISIVIRRRKNSLACKRNNCLARG